MGDHSDKMRKAVARLVDQDRKKRFIVTVLTALLAVGAVGVAVENVDDAYLANKLNLVAYVPDRVAAGGPSTIMVFAVDGAGEPLDGQEVDVRLVTGDSYFTMAPMSNPRGAPAASLALAERMASSHPSGTS